MELLFEKSKNGRHLSLFPPSDVPNAPLDSALLRKEALHLPQVSENDISRHYTALSKRAFGVNSGFYPLGSCTMKYNPKLNERVQNYFLDLHPLQEKESVTGCLSVISGLKERLTELTGMEDMTLQPAAGAHGEFTGILLIKKYHEMRKDFKRTKIIVPDSAHGTNPATAVMCGYTVVSVKSDENGLLSPQSLKEVLDDQVAGLMLTNPNTVGLFDKNILTLTALVHDCGGLCYYDGANLNAVMGVARPGDMGFDVVHLNLHKTLATPHGGGGPGSGAVLCKSILAPYLPFSKLGDTMRPNSIGQVKAFYGNFLVYLKAYTYMLVLGGEGLTNASKLAVLNANYLMKKMKDSGYIPQFDRVCMHEFVLSLEKLKEETGVSALDVAKCMLDHGVHPPTMYFPLIVHEALMFEPTETESKETLDKAAQIYADILKEVYEHRENVLSAPLHAPIMRPDEVQAARNPVVTFQKK